MTNEQFEFIQNIATACKNNSNYNILPSLTIAQAIKESNWGKSQLGALYYNFFGMKWSQGCGCERVSLPTKEWRNGVYVNVIAEFRKYNNFDEGIKGYYDFITGYKRYANLIGEKNSYLACKKIQQDGWATSPTYGDSLYHNYVLPYNLLQYDGNDVTNEYYKIGNEYTLTNDLYVRETPMGVKKKYSCVTPDAQRHGCYDGYGNAILYKDTVVTCKEVVELEYSTWIRIPSGWICAKNSTNVYVI